ncbi:MAG: DUF6526 family protein [Ignavibacteria bacterium]
MKEQNYKNHKRYLIGYHGITFTLLFILLVVSVHNLYVSLKNHYDVRTGIMFFIISVSMLLIFFYSRTFALKAQDRAIRAEENLRYFIISGKPMDIKITMSQLLALRFADDDELVELSEKAVEEGLSSD